MNLCRHRRPTGCEICERAAIIFVELTTQHGCDWPCVPANGRRCLCARDADKAADMPHKTKSVAA